MPNLSHPCPDGCAENAQKWLRTMLGFACGGLLGDVFFHILPEVASLSNCSTLNRHQALGEARTQQQANGTSHNPLADPVLWVGIWVSTHSTAPLTHLVAVTDWTVLLYAP